jgi:hypothetical protein
MSANIERQSMNRSQREMARAVYQPDNELALPRRRSWPNTGTRR